MTPAPRKPTPTTMFDAMRVMSLDPPIRNDRIVNRVEPTQMKIWSRFAGMLGDNGHLYIGHSERVSGEAKNQFDNIGITTYRYTGKYRRGA